MRAYGACCLFGLVLVVGPAKAAEAKPKVIRETWDAAYLDGHKAGFVHTTVREGKNSDRTIRRTTQELNLTVKRFNDTISLRMEVGTDETPEGEVVGVSMRQFLGKQQQLVMTGLVEDDQLHVKVEGGRRLDKKIPWNDQVVGLYRQDALFREHKVKPGDEFSYLSYEPQLTAVVTTRVKVKDFEEVAVPGSKKKQRLLRVEALPDKIGDFQPPTMTSWLDKDLRPVRSQFEVPGLGKLLLTRGTREAVLEGTGEAAPLVQIDRKQLIPLNRRILRPYDTRAVVYRVTVEGDDNPTTMFAQDERQKVKNAKGNSFEIHVRAATPAEPEEEPGKVKDEYLKSCYFINCDDERVKRLAREAVGRQTDPWQKALRIERWVHDHMENKNYSEAFATADHVARTLEGDCTEHAVLAAAMCRAAGVPSRTALGLLYVDDREQGPVLGFHMWAEVWARGQWLPIDGTLGRGYVGASHLKISDHSWYDIQSLTPLLPVVRVLGKVAIEVKSAE
jgi:hypothetical protein